MSKIKVVTIGRRFCTGGSDIGKMVAQRLGVKCYDRELVEKAAEMGRAGQKRALQCFTAQRTVSGVMEVLHELT